MTPARSNWQLALSRFGYGARPGDGERAGDPKEALLAELAAPRGARIENVVLRSTPQILQDVYAYEARQKMEREAAALAALAGSAMPTPEVAAMLFPAASPATTAGPEMAAPGSMNSGAALKPEAPPQQTAFRTDARARLAQAYAAPVGFVERLVAFWSNHFCVSVAKGPIGRGAAGAFEREAIRPHVLGRFADMLLAVERHPAMLNFLDNQQSIGPNSQAGHNNKSGLNENFAREILELHTMGVGSGYTQADVTQLAYILTGWTIVGREGKLGEPGTFVFNANAHEPTAATLLGRLYMQEGVKQGEARARGYRARGRDGEPYRLQVRTPFRRGFARCGPRSAARRGLPRDRRRSGGARARARERRGRVERAADQDSQSLGIDHRRLSRVRSHPRRSRSGAERAQSAWHAALATRRPQWLQRRLGRLDLA